MVTVETISIVFTGLSISLAAFYYISTLRNAEKSRKRELILQRHQSYSLEYTRTFWEMASWTDWETVEEYNELVEAQREQAEAETEEHAPAAV